MDIVMGGAGGGCLFEIQLGISSYLLQPIYLFHFDFEWCGASKPFVNNSSLEK